MAHAQDGAGAAAHFGVRQVDVGNKVRTLTYADLDSLVTIDPHKASATVIIFVALSCPTSMAYNERMFRLYESYHGKGVQFYFMDSEHGFSAQSRQGWKERSATTPMARLVHGDVGSQLAHRLGPEHTPDVFVFDSAGVLRYRGGIDDGGEGHSVKAESEVTKQFLRMALDALLAGQPVPVAKSKSFGCLVWPAPPPGAEVAKQN